MNERIKELLDQATIDALFETQNAVDLLDNPVTKQQRQLQLEKFAELIVRECDRYVAEQYDELEPWMQPGDLLKHFGVEE